MKKRRKKASENRLLIFGTVSILIISFFLYNLFSYIMQVKNLNNEQIKLENDLILLMEEEKNLKNEIEKLKDPDYLARFARENYMYSKDGEYIIKVSEKSHENNDLEHNDNKNYVWVVIVSSIFLIFALFIKRFI